MIIEQDILKSGINELFERGKIDLTTKNDMYTFISKLSKEYTQFVNYTDFNKTSSIDCTFTDSTRTVSYGGSGDAVLLTNQIVLNNIRINSLKLKGTDENVVWKISYNGTDYYTLEKSYDVGECVLSTSTGFYLKVEFYTTNSIKGIEINYEPLV